MPIAWDVHAAGAGAGGDGLSADVLDSVRSTRVALKGPTASTTGGPRPVSVRLRKALDLPLGVRPARTWRGVDDMITKLDISVLRMTDEDLYEGLELEPDDPAAAGLRHALAARGREVSTDTAFSLKPMSTHAIERFAHSAVAYARAAGRRRLTIVHKATVMRATDGRFLSIVRDVATESGDFDVDDRLVDTTCLDLVRHSDRFDVLLTPVMYGDIVSDLVAGLSGGLGLAPGANLGPDAAVFEPVHGTAPTLVGLDRANPLAAILTGAMLLRHLGESVAAGRVEAAVGLVLAAGEVRTYDLAGWARDDPRAATTSAMTEAVITALSTS